MITEREKQLLDFVKVEGYTEPNIFVDLFTDTEIIDNIGRFLNINNFKITKKYKDIIINSTEKDFEKMYELNYSYSLPIPLNLNDYQLHKVIIDNNFGRFMDKYYFTRNYWYILNKKNIIQYKKYIDFDTLIYTNFNPSDEIINLIYDDLLKVYNSSILNGINNEKKPYLNKVLLDKIENFNKKINSIDHDTIDNLLEGCKTLPYTNSESLNKIIFNNFTDEYIINNIYKFNYLHILYSGRMTEEIFQAMIDYANKNNILCDFDIISKILMQYENCSKEFLDKNIKHLQQTCQIYFQKEIMYLYDKYDWIDANKILALNKYITDDDIKVLLPNFDWVKMIDSGSQLGRLSGLVKERIVKITTLLTKKEKDDE